MISRRMQLAAVASATLSAATALAFGLVAAVPAWRGSATAAQVALAVSALAALATVPLRDEGADRVDLWMGNGLYAFLAACRVLGVAVAAGRWTLAEARIQAVFSVILQLVLLVAASLGARAMVAVFVGILAFALTGAALDARSPAAMISLAWAALTLVRWVQCEVYLQRALPVTDHGRLAPWRLPAPAWIAAPIELVANSRTMQLLLEPLPVPEMRSDITAAVYVSYLVEAERLARFVPEGLALQRLGPGGRYALFTFLTYRHGHFGFSFLGPLRRVLPSPFQTNWRVHVVDPRTGQRGIRFVTSAIDRALPAIAARLLSEGMPMHVLARASIERDADGTLRLALDPGRGSAPDARATLRPAGPSSGVYRDAGWEAPWRECFPDLRAFLEYCVPQDRAMDAQPWRDRVSRQEIHLGIPIDACVPLVGEVESAAARAIVGDAKPVCFLVPEVAFRFRVEAYDPITPAGAARSRPA